MSKVERIIWFFLCVFIFGLFYTEYAARKDDMKPVSAPIKQAVPVGWHETGKPVDINVEALNRISGFNEVYILGEPWHVILKPKLWDVVVGDNIGTVTGFTNCSKNIIYLVPTNEAETREDLFHELLHAGTCHHKEGNLWYNSKDVETHEGIYRIAFYMSELLAANPELAKYFGRIQ